MSTQTRNKLLQTMRGEAFAFVKYMLFAEQARQNGREELATLFEETAQTDRLEHSAEAATLAWLVDNNSVRNVIGSESREMAMMTRDFSGEEAGEFDDYGAARFDLDQALQTILDMTVQICGADFGLLSLYDPGSQTLRPRASFGMDDASLERLEQFYPGTNAAAHGAAYARPARAGAEDTGTDPLSGDFLDLSRALGFQTVHNTPIFTRSNEILGVLSIHFKHGRRPAALDMQMANLCALYAADTLEAAKSQQALRDLNESLEREVAERTSQLRALALELTQTEQRERGRLAQELHDNIQQLLVAVKLQASVTLSEPGRTDTVHEVISLTDEAISCCRALVEGLSPPMLRDADLPETMKRLAVHMRSQHGLDVQLVVEEPVRLASEDVRILLFEIARELLFNIVKHAKTHQAVLRVGRENGHVLLEVTDEGAGCDSKVLEKTGAKNFGLFSIRKRLTVLGGSMQTWAAPEQGCRIRVIVPVTAEVSEPEASPVESVEALPLQATFPGGLRVLLVDDHQILRQGMATLLAAQAGTLVIGQAGDGLEAIEMARTLEPDVIVMDISMPRMDGIEATRRILAEMPHIRVVGLSMYESDEMALAMKDAGAEAFLRKDDPLEHLLGVLRGA